MKQFRSVRVARGRYVAGAVSLLAGLSVLAAGCNEYPQSTFQLHSEFAVDIQDLFTKILVAAAVVFVLVEGILVLAAVRFRRKPSDGLPTQTHGNSRLEIGWTAAPAIVLAFIMVPTIQTIFRTQAPAPAGSLQVRVIGHQWWWELQYPELGVVTANELHLPLGKTANFMEESADVIHSFWIPALGGKRDVVPGHVNHLWFTPSATGTFMGQCAEFCGESHANMRLRAIVETPDQFDAWVRQQKLAGATPAANTDAAKGAQAFQQRGCAGCHTIAGTSAQGQVGPNLSHVGSRTTIASGMFENTPDNLRNWLHNPGAVKPGALMPNLSLSDEDLISLVAYLQSLK